MVDQIVLSPPSTEPRPRRRSFFGRLVRGLIGLTVLAALGGGIWWIVDRATVPAAPGGPGGPGRGADRTPMPVVAAAAELGELPVTFSALGTVASLATVTVKPQVGGPLISVAFQEGQRVQKGDLLAEIDPRPFQLLLEQTQAQLQRDQALLRNAELDLERYRTLVKQDSIARQQRDTQEALVLQYQGAIKADQAQVATARLNLSYCRILAPITGRAGLRLVDSGNMVQANDATGIVVLTQVKPISVLFTLPEDSLPRIQERLRAGATLPVTVFDRSHARKLAVGALTTIDNQIDTGTGTIKLRAVFDNADETLFANQFVNVQVLVDTVRNAVIVPAAAVLRGSPGTYVYLVDGTGSAVTVRPVKLGAQDGDRMVVESGLAAGDRVVVDGSDRLREGARITLSGANKSATETTPAGETPRPAPDGDGKRPREGNGRPREGEGRPRP
jgi:multidrug efflux system membrane fusion protein